jgi:hypothetical protein
MAMSAATMLACSANEVVMALHSLARDRKRARIDKCGGRRSYVEAKQDTVGGASEAFARTTHFVAQNFNRVS